MFSPIAFSQQQLQMERMANRMYHHLYSNGKFGSFRSRKITVFLVVALTLHDPTRVSSQTAVVSSSLLSWVVDNVCGDNRSRGTNTSVLPVFIIAPTGLENRDRTSHLLCSCVVHDAWCMMHGAWCMMHAACYKHWPEKMLQTYSVSYPPTSTPVTVMG